MFAEERTSQIRARVVCPNADKHSEDNKTPELPAAEEQHRYEQGKRSCDKNLRGEIVTPVADGIRLLAEQFGYKDEDDEKQIHPLHCVNSLYGGNTYRESNGGAKRRPK